MALRFRGRDARRSSRSRSGQVLGLPAVGTRWELWCSSVGSSWSRTRVARLPGGSACGGYAFLAGKGRGQGGPTLARRAVVNPSGGASGNTMRKRRSVAAAPGPSRSASAAAITRSSPRPRWSLAKVASDRGGASRCVCLNWKRSRRPAESTVVRSSKTSSGTSLVSTWQWTTVPSMRSTSLAATSRSWYSYPRWAGASGRPALGHEWETCSWMSMRDQWDVKRTADSQSGASYCQPYCQPFRVLPAGF